MRRTHWAVFTSMNPRPSAWRAIHEPTPPVAGDQAGDGSRQPAAPDTPHGDPVLSDPANQRLEV